MSQSSSIFRYYIADGSNVINELDLTSATSEILLQQAIFEIKALVRRFDA
ncbi:MAG: hypothetical protein IT292_03525 [Deltaproteobacteria bacterium]|nr:hypothetical protein [Deltaproteobacteria bacterium]